jgi:hypothetical protein
MDVKVQKSLTNATPSVFPVTSRLSPFLFPQESLTVGCPADCNPIVFSLNFTSERLLPTMEESAARKISAMPNRAYDEKPDFTCLQIKIDFS